MNARSILNKLDSLESVLLTVDPDFLAVTETWLSNEIGDAEIAPPNYCIVRKDRATRGGGVAILINKRIRFTQMPVVEGAEAVFCNLLCGSFSIVVGCVYRSPGSDHIAMQSLHAYMQRNVKGKRLILLGDFNLPDINWRTMQHECLNSETLFDAMLSFNLNQIIMEPTRVQAESSNILDLVFLSDHFPSDKHSVEILDGISDHKLIVCSASICAKKSHCHSQKNVPDFQNADDTSIIDHLSIELAPFAEDSKRASISVDELWLKFKHTITHCMKLYVPNKTKRSKKYNPWINRDIIHAKRKVKRLRKSLKLSKSKSKTALTTAITDMKLKIRTAKKNYFTNTLPSFIKNSPQKFWGFLKNSKSSENASLSQNGLITPSSLNEHFQSVFTADDGNQPPIDILNKEPLELPVITEQGIFHLLLQLDTKKASGPDNIPNLFLNRYAEWMAKYLCIIFDKSLATCTIPDDWKKAKVKPIHKSGPKDDVNNFRPISLTCTCSKLLEHIILKHINIYLENERILSPSQHGFRRGLSTVTQLTELTHDLSLSVDNQKQVDLILLDFAKAFDKVSHKKLVQKLECTLGNGSVTKWIKNYLTGRTQFVDFNGQVSTTVPVKSGVPQGCVLAPTLFLIFINDLPCQIPVHVRLFADDCIIYHEINSAEDHLALNKALEIVSNWCSDWQMILNVKKSAIMTVTRKREWSEFSYTINSIPLPRTSHHKYLGLTFTSDLRWDAHVSNVTATALKRLFFLRRCLRLAPSEIKLLAYNTYVRSVLEYANIVWFPYTKKHIAKLEGVQRKAVRFIFNKFRQTDSPTEMLEEAGMLTLQKRARLARLRFMYQLRHKQTNIDASRYITLQQSRPTRKKHPEMLQEYAFRTECFKHSFFPASIREWNSLAAMITSSNSLNIFSRLVEEHLRLEP